MTLTQISKISGVPLRTLQRWRTSRPFVYQAVVEKCERYKAKRDEYNLQA